MLVAIAALIGAVLGSGGLAGALRVRSQNRQTDANTDGINQDSMARAANALEEIYGGMVRELRIEVERIIARERECRTELDKLRIEIAALRQQVAATRSDVQTLSDKVSDKEP